MPRSPKRFRPRAFGSWVLLLCCGVDLQPFLKKNSQLLVGEGLTSLCSAAASHRSFLSSFSSFAPRHSSPATSALGLSSVPYRSPRGPLQRTALSKKLINQLFLFLATMSANKFAPYYPKTKGVEFSTPFCFVCSLRREGDSKVEPLGSSSRGYHIGVGCKPSHKHNFILATPHFK